MREWLEWMDSVRAAVSGIDTGKACDLFDTLSDMYGERKQEKNVKDVLIGDAYKDGRSVSSALSDFVRWLTEVFDYTHLGDYHENLRKACAANAVYGELLFRWERDVRHGAFDWFGTIYEETFQGKGKADALGQFYTPQSVCRLIGEINEAEDRDMVFCDCCCGSGRLLLSVKTKSERFSYFIGEDIDIESVRMCALNLMINNKRGMVVCHDSLSWDRFVTAYEVNESNSPFESGLLSIRQISRQEAEDKLSGKDNSVLVKERMVKRALQEKAGTIDINEPFVIYANEYAPRQYVSNPPFGMKLSKDEQKKIGERFSMPKPEGCIEIVPEARKVENGQYLLF